jgi:hypothetical protein
MNIPDGEHSTLAHRLVRWLAVLTLAYGLVNMISVVIAVQYRAFWMSRSGIGRSWPASFGYVIVVACLAVAEVIGAIALLKWKSLGRTILLVRSISAILISFVATLYSIYVYTEAAAATTQPGYQPYLGYVVWNWIHNWTQGCVLSLVLIITLLQPEVKKIWAVQRAGGFDVIPMASTAEQPPS